MRSPTNHTGRDTDAGHQLLLGDRIQPRDRGDNVESRPYRTLGIVFMCARKAEIHQ
jgi:hypothetical protein